MLRQKQARNSHLQHVDSAFSPVFALPDPPDLNSVWRVSSSVMLIHFLNRTRLLSGMITVGPSRLLFGSVAITMMDNSTYPSRFLLRINSFLKRFLRH